MGTCHTCGAKLPNNAKFCVVCGEPVDSATLPTNQLPGQGEAGHSSAHEAQGASSFAEAGPTKPVLDWSSVAYVPTEPVTHNPFAKPPSKLRPRPLAEVIQSPPFATPPFQVPPGPYTPRRQRRRTRLGCVAWLIILVLMLILLTTSMIALGQTILVPSITIANQSASNGQMHLHGSSFIPKDTITLMLDNTQPLYYNGRANTVTAKSDGTFDVTIPVGAKWRLGLHTIQALEGWSLRRAMVSFILDQAGEIPILTPTPTLARASTLTPVPASLATLDGELSGVMPSDVILGPVSADSVLTVSEQVALTATGAGRISWSASWDQASWLKLDQTSGLIQAPASQAITISAQANSLSQGTYTATVRFSSPQSAQSITLLVIFIVTAANS